MKHNDRPAFPGAISDGMALSDWFAGQALAGILANVAALRAQPPLTHNERAEAAYLAADAMLEERRRRAKGASA